MSNATQAVVTQQVVVTEVAQNLLEVLVPSQPNVIEVVTAGPQGALRLGAVLIDASTAGVIYVGTAPSGSAEGSAVWSIVRSVFSAAGIRTSKGTASGVTWTGRASHTYS